jgi:hypothetical protein
MTAPIEIDGEALAAIVAQDGHSLIPLSPAQRMRAALELRGAAMSARSDDEDSLALRARLDGVSAALETEGRDVLAARLLVVVPSALPHACLAQVERRPVVVVCRGLFDLVHFRTALSAICVKLARLLPSRDVAPGLPPGDAMMLAGQVALFDAYVNLRPPASMADMLSGPERRDLELGVGTSLLLLVLHEIGHDVLGHAASRSVSLDVDVVSMGEGRSKTRAEMEFEADAYAVDAIGSNWRPDMLASLISLHDVFQFLETFGVRPSPEYPSSGARLTAMVKRLGLGAKEQAFFASWQEDYARRQQTIEAGVTDPRTLARRFDGVMDARDGLLPVPWTLG